MLSTHCKLVNLDDVQIMLKQVKFMAQKCFDNETKISETLIISSEIAHNIVNHGGEGCMSISILDSTIQIDAEDFGTGLQFAIEEAFNEGVTSKMSLGCGLPAIERLSDDLYYLTSTQGTQIKCTIRFNDERAHST